MSSTFLFGFPQHMNHFNITHLIVFFHRSDKKPSSPWGETIFTTKWRYLKMYRSHKHVSGFLSNTIFSRIIRHCCVECPSLFSLHFSKLMCCAFSLYILEKISTKVWVTLLLLSVIQLTNLISCLTRQWFCDYISSWKPSQNATYSA